LKKYKIGYIVSSMERAPDLTCSTCPNNTKTRTVLGKLGLARTDKGCMGPEAALIRGRVVVDDNGAIFSQEMKRVMCRKDLPPDYNERVAVFEAEKSVAEAMAKEIRERRLADGTLDLDGFPPIFED